MIRTAIFLLTFLYGTATAQDHPVQIEFQQRIPTRSGLKLSANIYRPTNIPDPMPALLAITPYGADRMHREAMYLAQHGYAVVVADSRGRGNSEGSFIPFEYDGKDGYDICKWIGKKEWCNGKIGMFGGSYLGKVQWLTAREHPENLVTIVPIASGAPGIDLPMVNNIFLSFNAQWLTLVYGRTANMGAYTDLAYWNRVYETAFKHYAPYIELPEVAGIDGNILQRWLQHPEFDSYWQDLQYNELDWRYNHTTALTVTGYFDDNQRGAVYYHKNLMLNAPDSVRENSYIIIGPWDHAGSRFPKNNVHNMEFDDAAVISIGELQIEWFDWQLKGKEPPLFLRGKAMYYEMGAERWTAADSLGQMHDTTNVLYLQGSRDGDNSLYNAGKLLTTMPKGLSRTEIEYNPLDTANTDYRILEHFIDYSWRDENAASFPEKAVYHTEPFKRDVTICGVPQLTAHISLNVPDADFEAILYEIKPDGTCIYLTSDIMRARYRKGLQYPNRVPRGEVQEYVMDTFHSVCRKLHAGSRLRLVFGFLNSPYYEKNYHSGKEVHLETDRAARPAEMKIGHGSKYPTALTIPVRR